ncbi:MAG: hypothetical protein N2554_09610, partial [Fimbriimonadales bacterium]|nr:hypothetical protein [Fimbriimonadales bacterium]
VADLYRVVDYIMTLSKMRDELVRKIIREKEAESEYPLTSFEELALERGVEQGLKQGTVRSIIRLLRARFGVDASWLEPHLMEVKSLDTLDNILNEATNAESIEVFLRRLSRRLRVSLRQPHS